MNTYKQKNKERWNEYMREFREANKDHINELRRQRRAKAKLLKNI